jgi:hypothetical protein
MGARAACFRFAAAGIAATLPWSSAAAGELKLGAIDFDLATTLTASATYRAQGRAADLVGFENGGTGEIGDVSSDDGTLNFARGDATSQMVSALHELEARWANLTAFTRVNYFYDRVYAENDVRFAKLGRNARRDAGYRFDVLDAFVAGAFEVAERPLDIRLGRQAISWGESLYIGGGLSSISPYDFGQLVRPGSPLKEGLLPFWAARVDTSPVEGLTVSAFYQLAWRPNRQLARGTFFSTWDVVAAGADRNPVGSNTGEPLDLLDPDNPIFFIGRENDVSGADQGQFGISLRGHLENLNDGTDVGIYFARINSRDPFVGSILRGLDPFTDLNYRLVYPDRVDLYGLSASTSVAAFGGMVVQGEVTYRRHQPLGESNQAVFERLFISEPGASADGYIRRDTVQAQIGWVASLGPEAWVTALGGDAATISGEVAVFHVRGMPSAEDVALFGTGPTPPTATSAGYVLDASIDYFDVVPKLTLSPTLTWSQDIEGNTPYPFVTFKEGRKSVTVGSRFTYSSAWSGALTYTNYFGARGSNDLQDRDHVALRVSYAF